MPAWTFAKNTPLACLACGGALLLAMGCGDSSTCGDASAYPRDDALALNLVAGAGQLADHHAATPPDSPVVKLVIRVRLGGAGCQYERRSDGNDDQLRQRKGAMANATPGGYPIANAAPTSPRFTTLPLSRVEPSGYPTCKVRIRSEQRMLVRVRAVAVT